MLQWFPLGPSVSKLGPWPRHAHQRSMETPLLLNWQTPSLRRIQIDTDTHTRHRTTDKAVWMCARVCQAHTHTHLHTHGVSHGLSCRQQSSVNWDLFCSPQGTITLLSYLSVFSLSPPSLSYILSMPRPSLIAPSPPPCLFLISRMTICDLYTMPRVAEPVWLTMMSGVSEKNQLCGQFMRELSLLMEQASKNQLSIWLLF